MSYVYQCSVVGDIFSIDIFKEYSTKILSRKYFTNRYENKYEHGTHNKIIYMYDVTVKYINIYKMYLGNRVANIVLSFISSQEILGRDCGAL